ncbi:hypothetical protein [Erysipelothrix anatis]|uniref:hypothetical protein n=1 Tax=Erysipelothrix anatis TaxID=2683713 RepID=UPI00135C0E1F|nr:hypothetical protein [Erysipelothrix anatis]
MYKFFSKHTGWRTLLDWCVLLGSALAIFSLFPNLDLSTAWFVPIYVNLFVIVMFAYVDRIHEPPENRMDSIQWLNNIRWINGIAFVLHMTIGFYKRYTNERVVEPLWMQAQSSIVATIAIYVCMIVVPSVLIYFLKQHR